MAFQFVLLLLRVAGAVLHRVAMTEGMKVQIAKELAELDRRVGKTKKIIANVDKLNEEDIDSALRGD